MSVRAAISDWLLARYLERRCEKRKATFCRRRSDGTLWAAHCPQNFGYAMSGLFHGGRWHFARVSIWRGLPIVSPKVFWNFGEMGQFDVIGKDATAFWLSPWPEAIECDKLDATPRDQSGAVM